jgi:hypothetical protein
MVLPPWSSLLLELHHNPAAATGSGRTEPLELIPIGTAG